MATFLFFTLALTLTLCIFTTSVSSSNPEVDGLISFKQGLTDPANVLVSWDQNLADPCTWLRIVCNADNKVTQIYLGSLNLAGKLVPGLGNLQELQILELYENKLDGPIPNELGKLTNLISLDLSENNLSGGLPSSLENLKQLRSLHVNDNKLLSGPVPTGLLGITSLNITNTGLTKPPFSRRLLTST